MQQPVDAVASGAVLTEVAVRGAGAQAAFIRHAEAPIEGARPVASGHDEDVRAQALSTAVVRVLEWHRRRATRNQG